MSTRTRSSGPLAVAGALTLAVALGAACSAPPQKVAGGTPKRAGPGPIGSPTGGPADTGQRNVPATDGSGDSGGTDDATADTGNSTTPPAGGTNVNGTTDASASAGGAPGTMEVVGHVAHATAGLVTFHSVRSDGALTKVVEYEVDGTPHAAVAARGLGALPRLVQFLASETVVVWRGNDAAGQVGRLPVAELERHVVAGWRIAGVGDFNGDGLEDVAWRNRNQAVALWHFQAPPAATTYASLNSIPFDWAIEATGDFDGDGKDDLFWRHSGAPAFVHSVWSGASVDTTKHFGIGTFDPAWKILQVGDYDGNGQSDLLVQEGALPTAGRILFLKKDAATGAVKFDASAFALPAGAVPATTRLKASVGHLTPLVLAVPSATSWQVRSYVRGSAGAWTLGTSVDVAGPPLLDLGGFPASVAAQRALGM